MRTAKDTYIEDRKGDSCEIGELSIPLKMKYLWLEECLFTKNKYGLVTCIIWHQPKHKDPIYLVSNLEWAKDIIDYYQQRWTIDHEVAPKADLIC